ncbi:Antitoxin PezA [Sebaldella termitidis]|uniref:Transcriptional regulator, XRE family n=1 Tax=Sebaldella termitidis (strain ATCC 33386 / NCTC 11300) TaxID=526218 RepID=D1AHN0_SEBTE|nr:helix-turn-helix transcriptional regulator [Sebaldella termitidis]ACZ08264.1 transcriptional regulator, XRE family [Sebaldella termitidis ATCC 33386]SUI23572.1 Antitoxin PezA [Sebaldella termitidis]
MYKLIGSNIKNYRKTNKLTQQELADKIGKHKITVAKYESGKISVPMAVLHEISEILDTPMSDFFKENPISIDNFEPKEKYREFHIIERIKKYPEKTLSDLMDVDWELR